MQKAKADGIIRDVKGQSYTEDLDRAATRCWRWPGRATCASAHDRHAVAQVHPPDRGRDALDGQPDDPEGAPSTRARPSCSINYYYDPSRQRRLTAGVDYISPVKGADELMIKADPDAANNPLVIPPPDWVAAHAHLRRPDRGGRARTSTSSSRR